jgi:hypothetical protein
MSISRPVVIGRVSCGDVRIKVFRTPCPRLISCSPWQVPGAGLSLAAFLGCRSLTFAP